MLQLGSPGPSFSCESCQSYVIAIAFKLLVVSGCLGIVVSLQHWGVSVGARWRKHPLCKSPRKTRESMKHDPSYIRMHKHVRYKRQTRYNVQSFSSNTMSPLDAADGAFPSSTLNHPKPEKNLHGHLRKSGLQLCCRAFPLWTHQFHVWHSKHDCKFETSFGHSDSMNTLLEIRKVKRPSTVLFGVSDY